MTAQPHGNLDTATYQRHLRDAADALVAAVRAGRPDAPVASCPDWTVHELVEHLGQVHLWAGSIVENGEPPPRGEIPGIPAGADLAGWYAEQADRLLDTLTRTPPDRSCWAHQPGRQVAAYWSRRQAHEAAMHRIDVDLTRGRRPAYDPELAADGVAEVLDVWFERLHAWAGIVPDLPAPVLLTCTDRPDRWLVVPRAGAPADCLGPRLSDEEAGTAAARLGGTAFELLCALWKRRDPTAGTDSDASSSARPDLAVDGDATVAERFLASTLTP